MPSVTPMLSSIAPKRIRRLIPVINVNVPVVTLDTPLNQTAAAPVDDNEKTTCCQALREKSIDHELSHACNMSLASILIKPTLFA
jgi:hypothetical protein